MASDRTARALASILAVLLLLATQAGAFAEERSRLTGLRVTSVGEIGPPSKRVDLVIVGDGYIADDLRPGGKWEIDTARLVKNFFEKVPFKTLRHLFNVHLVEVASQERGADDGPGKDTRRTALDCTYGHSGIDRLLVCQDEDAAIEAASNALAVDIILILVNDGRPGGSGGTIGYFPGPCCSTEPTAFLIAIHELGHSFANLGDEYVDANVADQYPLPDSGDLDSPNLTLVELVDTSSREKLIETLKWGHFLDEPGADKLYGKGFFEGGHYRAKGVYRPAPSCIMADESGGGRFCFVCYEEMTRAVHRTAGRGPGGGVFPHDLPPMKGRLRRARFHYGTGIFGRVAAELARLEKRKDLSDKETAEIARLRAGMRESLDRARLDVAKLVGSGDALGAEEHIRLLEISFKGTEHEKLVDAKVKEVSGADGFKSEVKAGRDLLKLEVALRDQDPQRKTKARKMLDDFVKKHRGTKVAERVVTDAKSNGGASRAGGK